MKQSPLFVSAPVRVAVSRTPARLDSLQLDRLRRALAPLHAQYDPEQRALRKPLASPGYHTTLTEGFVHPTRESLQYAVALLDSNDPTLLTRAAEILRRIIGEQDQDPESKTYGIWPWFLEEPLPRMKPPDWNWADFCGAALLQAALDHRERLDGELLNRVDGAIIHAANSIVRRNVGPGYTNIAIMGSYVTLIAGELYGLAELKEYALERIRRLHAYTFQSGGLTEFNSPTYTLVAIAELGRIRLHAIDPEARKLIEDIYRMAWEDVAQHFHPPTRQWAGPHSRCYSTFIADQQLAFIERSVQTRLGWGKCQETPSVGEHRLPTPCPSDLDGCFVGLDGPREVVKTFFKGPPACTATTWLTREFALGSVSRGDLWNQRRSLLAYWGEAERPSYLHVRCLRDGHDFAAAQFFSVQDKGRVLAGVNFASDGGNTHPSLDPLNDGQFRASQLRLRFEFGGGAAGEQPEIPLAADRPVRLRLGKIWMELAVVMARFEDERASWQLVRDEKALSIDLVLYQGAERVFNLAGMQGGVGFTVTIAAQPIESERATSELVDGRWKMQWSGLKLSFPAKSATVDEMQKSGA